MAYNEVPLLQIPNPLQRGKTKRRTHPYTLAQGLILFCWDHSCSSPWNVVTYAQDGSEVYLMAERMDKKFDELFSALGKHLYFQARYAVLVSMVVLPPPPPET